MSYPQTARGYELTEQIGRGSAATVFRAFCPQVNEEVAIKVIDLEWFQVSLETISKEIQIMSLASHPNVVGYQTSFVDGHDLWLVMPLLTGGSVLSLMQTLYPQGLPEEFTKYILYETLKALHYFHSHGQIHRDVKAANILLSSQGQVMLSDYGMMGWMVENGEVRKARQTFVGTPCWMAPEVMEQKHGYNYKADIWSFGITAIELAQGQAPYMNYPPVKVLLMTLGQPPPRLDPAVAATYSKSFKEMLDLCLQKLPTGRASTTELLNHRFFRNVKEPDNLPTLLKKLPPLGSRAGGQTMLYRQLRRRAGQTNTSDLSEQVTWDFDTPEDVSTPAVVPAAKVPVRPPSELNLAEAKGSVDGSAQDLAAKSSDTSGKLRKGRFTVSEVELNRERSESDMAELRANNSEPMVDYSEGARPVTRRSRFEVKDVENDDSSPRLTTPLQTPSDPPTEEPTPVPSKSVTPTPKPDGEQNPRGRKGRFEVSDVKPSGTEGQAGQEGGDPVLQTQPSGDRDLAQPVRKPSRFEILEESDSPSPALASVAPANAPRIDKNFEVESTAAVSGQKIPLHEPPAARPAESLTRPRPAPVAPSGSKAPLAPTLRYRTEANASTESVTMAGFRKPRPDPAVAVQQSPVDLLRTVMEQVEQLVLENEALRKELATLKNAT